MFTKPKTEAKNTISQEEYEKRIKELQTELEELKKSFLKLSKALECEFEEVYKIFYN